jgi:hypothetical protein
VSGRYEYPLDLMRTVWLTVRFETVRREVFMYSIVLAADIGGNRETIRVYDAAHGFNEMHRHTRHGGKQSGESFHAGTLGEGMRAAIAECTDRYETMIEAWHR